MQANLEATLATLVAIQSTADNLDGRQTIINFLKKELRACGLHIQLGDRSSSPWLIASTHNTKTPDILLFAHVDVVPGPKELFHMRKHNGNLYGRGVYDMKFAAACYIEFFRLHASKLSELTISLLFTTDEEADSDCMPKVIATGLHPKVVFLPDGGNNWAIEKRAKAFYGVELMATGKAAHGSRPWEGDSALHTLLDAIEPLRTRYAFKSKHEPTLMVNGIHGGQALNQIPDHAYAELDFRCFNPHELQEFIDFITDITLRYPTISMKERHRGEAIEFDETSPHVQSFLQAFRTERGTAPAFEDSYGGSDARYFTALGIPCIIIEPEGGGRHSDNEWLKANDLALFYRLIERWILEEEASVNSLGHYKEVQTTPSAALA